MLLAAAGSGAAHLGLGAILLLTVFATPPRAPPQVPVAVEIDPFAPDTGTVMAASPVAPPLPVAAIAPPMAVAVPVPPVTAAAAAEPTIRAFVPPPARAPAAATRPRTARQSPVPAPSAESAPSAPSADPATSAPAPAMSAPAVSGGASWRVELARWLDGRRTYPEAARARGEEGVAILRCTVARDGTIVAVDLLRSSGSDTLDSAALAIFRGAHLPPFSPDMTQAQATLTIPIRYRLQQ